MKTLSNRQKAETWLFDNPVRAYVGKGEKAADVIYNLYDSLEKLLDEHAEEQRELCATAITKRIKPIELHPDVIDACLNAEENDD